MAVELYMKRDYRDARCVTGWLNVYGGHWPTLESVQCVPAGRYRVERHSSEAYPRVWALVNAQLGVHHAAEGSALIKQGNFPAHVAGRSIAIGKARVSQGGMFPGVWLDRSRDALNELRNIIGYSYDIWLTIEEHYP